MISHVSPKRTRIVTEQARKRVVHGFCLSKSETNVENGLDEDLSERQSTPMQM